MVGHLAVPADYVPLFKYLDRRFADTVVLTFGEIESILGFALPALALEGAWWANDRAVEAPSRAWTEASRTATPNLPARRVSFERGAD